MQYLVKISWYETNELGLIQADTEDKALKIFLENIMELDYKRHRMYDFSLPLFCYDNDLTKEENIEKYMKEQIGNKEVSTLVLEVPQGKSCILHCGENYKDSLTEI